ncbi:hypothetical protein M514_23324 [Trichuris suis]|uniref:Uncharacterized protein n=1 Tax=Trichuris suis TaxID=68888 RepID=A0A085N4T1_9BILA|nr:hypothetical protein M514_23324 [Trichuris suis]
MDQGVIATFKAFYLRRTFQQALDFIAPWDEVKGSTLNAAWCKLYPGVTTESSGQAEPIQHLHQEIAGLAHQVGLGEINEEDAAELLKSQDEELSNSDLLEIERQLTEDQEASEPRNPE